MDRPSYLKKGKQACLFPALAEKNLENRTLSSFLSCLVAIPEYRECLLQPIGLSASKRGGFTAWTEVEFKKDKDLKDKKNRPDGLVVISKGGKECRILFEAKIGKNELKGKQIENYVELANENQVNALITISNQFTATPNHHPCGKLKTGHVKLYHWSWRFVMIQAHLLLQAEEFKNEDRIYLLEEWVRFLNHEKSGVSSFTAMDKSWADLVKQVASSFKLNKNDNEVVKAISSWQQEIQDLSITLSDKLDTRVYVLMSGADKKDFKRRFESDADKLCKDKYLEMGLRIPNAASDLYTQCNLEGRTINISMHVDAPSNKSRTKGRIMWITKQLKDVKGKIVDDLSIRAYWGKGTGYTQESLKGVRENWEELVHDNKEKIPTSFSVIFVKHLGKNFARPKKFIEKLEEAVISFYENIGQNLKKYNPPIPRIKETKETVDDSASPQEDMDESIHTDQIVEKIL